MTKKNRIDTYDLEDGGGRMVISSPTTGEVLQDKRFTPEQWAEMRQQVIERFT